MRLKTVAIFIITQLQLAGKRSAKVWWAITREQRIASLAAFLLGATMILPWYEKTTSGIIRGRLEKVHENLSAFQAFSFVEAAVLLVAVGSLALIWTRGEGKTFKLPFDDGLVLAAGGVWVAVLVFYRFLDKPKGLSNPVLDTTVGLQWGIFVTLLSGLFLASAGMRSRTHSHQGVRGPRGTTPVSDERMVSSAQETAATVVVVQEPTSQTLSTTVRTSKLAKPANNRRKKPHEDQLRLEAEEE